MDQPPQTRPRRIDPAGLGRALAMLFYVVAGLWVFEDLNAKLHWQASAVASLSLVGWAYAAPLRNRIDLWLLLASMLAVAGAFVVMLSPGLARALPAQAELDLGALAAAALAGAVATGTWFVVRDRRRERARLKARHPSTVERASGGF